MDYDIYELSERERRVVFTALDLYREAAEKQQEANEKKVRVQSHEIAELIAILNGDDLNFGLLHKFLPREARERIEREREERERKEREKRAQMGLFSEEGGQTVEEALEGVEEEAERRFTSEQEGNGLTGSETESCPHERVRVEDGEPMMCEDCGAVIEPQAEGEPEDADPDDEELQAFLDDGEDEEPSIVQQLGELSSEGAEAEAEAREAESKPTADEEHTIRSAAAHFFRGDEAAQHDYTQGAIDAIAGRVITERGAGNGLTTAYVRGHRLGRTLLEKRRETASQEVPGPEPEASGDAIDDLVEELRGDPRPLTDYATLLTPTLISILKARGITTVGHVAERWGELPGIWGVGKTSLERLGKLLEDAGRMASVGVAADEGDDGALPF